MQRAVPVAFNGAFLPSTVGMAVVDGACRGLPFPGSSIVQLAKGKRVKDGLCYDSRYVVA